MGFEEPGEEEESEHDAGGPVEDLERERRGERRVRIGLGFAAGLLQYLRKPDWPEEPERVSPRKTVLRAV